MKLYENGEYRASDKWPYAISAGCVVYRQEGATTKILLLERNFDHDAYSAGDMSKPSYHLPKGHVEVNEPLEAAAVRETKEELGARVELVTYLGAIHHTFDHPRFQNTTNKEVHYFAAKWVEDVAKTDNEHDGRKWVAIDEAVKLLGKPNPKGEDELIHRLQAFLELPRVS